MLELDQVLPFIPGHEGRLFRLRLRHHQHMASAKAKRAAQELLIISNTVIHGLPISARQSLHNKC